MMIQIAGVGLAGAQVEGCAVRVLFCFLTGPSFLLGIRAVEYFLDSAAAHSTKPGGTLKASLRLVK
jgi:hypothetical protein